MMKWATAMVDELGNVAHATAKDVGVPEAFSLLQVFDLKAAVTPSLLGSACAGTLHGKMLTLWYRFLFMRMVF